jgi:hypothetical protein
MSVSTMSSAPHPDGEGQPSLGAKAPATAGASTLKPAEIGVRIETLSKRCLLSMFNAAISGCSSAQDERLEDCLLVRGLLSYRTQSRAFARKFGHSRLSFRFSRCCCSQVRMRSCYAHPGQRRHRRRGHSRPLANGRGSGTRSTFRMAGLRGVRHG